MSISSVSLWSTVLLLVKHTMTVRLKHPGEKLHTPTGFEPRTLKPITVERHALPTELIRQLREERDSGTHIQTVTNIFDATFFDVIT